MSDQRELLAQSIFPRLNCNQYLTAADYRDNINRMVESRSVGGFVLFDGDGGTVSETTTTLQALSDNGLLFAADCEDGVTMRFVGGTEFPSMMALGVSNDVAATYTVARSIAREMRSIGIGWNFAPVADINTNPDNPIINIRSFGESAQLVSDHAHAYLRGMQDGGVVACAKHFPGHGDTRVDSHCEMPVLDFDLRRLQSCELIPFRDAIRHGVRSIMVSHIAVPSLDPEGVPASLSQPIIGGLLREKYGYKGVIVTDALDMHAVTERYGAGEAAVMAYAAGVDVLAIPADPAAALDALVEAGKKKRFAQRRIKESVNRIAALRKWVASFQDDVGQTLDLAKKGHEVIALEGARRATQIRGTLRKIYPPLMVLAFVDEAENPKAGEWFGYFSSWYPGEASGVIATPEITPEDMRQIVSSIESAGTIIAPIFVRPRGYAGTVDLSPGQQRLADAALKRPTIILNFGNPYLLRSAEPDVRIDMYSACSASLAASIEALSRTAK